MPFVTQALVPPTKPLCTMEPCFYIYLIVHTFADFTFLRHPEHVDQVKTLQPGGKLLRWHIYLN